MFSASEIAQYSYCPLSWYLSRQEAGRRSWKGWLGRLTGSAKDSTPGQEEGLHQHARVGQAINRLQAEEATSRALRRLSMLLLFLSIAVFAWWLL
ncbi:MAG TPA: hypothetical protein PLI05_08090 [Methanotrichaceae archaeon]|nr:hypothetical protein [Methanotrichaceae archaeon]HQF17008.1 hypothetical protein [Methanotrichaceae archaeon]